MTGEGPRRQRCPHPQAPSVLIPHFFDDTRATSDLISLTSSILSRLADLRAQSRYKAISRLGNRLTLFSHASTMAWGSSKPKAPPPPASWFSKVFPLLVTFTIIGILAWVGFQVYLTASQIADRAGKKLEKKNVLLTKDGMRVGVKEVDTERYVDRSQRYAALNPGDPRANPRLIACWSRHGTSLPGQRIRADFGISLCQRIRSQGSSYFELWSLDNLLTLI